MWRARATCPTAMGHARCVGRCTMVDGGLGGNAVERNAEGRNIGGTWEQLKNSRGLRKILITVIREL